MMKNPWILEHPRVGIAKSCGTILEIVNERRAEEMLLQFQTASDGDWSIRQLTDAEMKVYRGSYYTRIR